MLPAVGAGATSSAGAGMTSTVGAGVGSVEGSKEGRGIPVFSWDTWIAEGKRNEKLEGAASASRMYPNAESNASMHCSEACEMPWGLDYMKRARELATHLFKTNNQEHQRRSQR